MKSLTTSHKSWNKIRKKAVHIGDFSPGDQHSTRTTVEEKEER